MLLDLFNEHTSLYCVRMSISVMSDLTVAGLADAATTSTAPLSVYVCQSSNMQRIVALVTAVQKSPIANDHGTT